MNCTSAQWIARARWVLVTAIASTNNAGIAQPVGVDPDFAPALISRSLEAYDPAFAPLPDGDFLVTGSFTYAGAKAAPPLIRLAPDGTVRESFAFAGPVDELSNLVVPLADGRFIVIRYYYDSGLKSDFRRYLADGSADPSFVAFTTFGGPVWMARSTTENRTIVAGDFLRIDGDPRDGVARLNADGTLDRSYAPAVLGSSTRIKSMAVDPGGRLVVSADSTIPLVARYHDDGTRDMGFNPELPPESYPYGPPYLLAALADGRVILQGDPPERWNADGTPDSTFAPGIPEGYSLDYYVPTDDGQAFVGASRSGNSQAYPERTVFRLNTDQSLAFDYRSLFPDANRVDLQAVLPGGRLLLVHGKYVNGLANFELPNDVRIPVTTYLVPDRVKLMQVSLVSIDGSVESTFIPPVGMPGTVAKLIAYDDGRVLVSGNFDLLPGGARAGLARLWADGSLDESFAPPPVANGRIRLLLVQPDGRLLVHMDAPGATATAYPIIQRLHADGSLDSTLAADSELATSYLQVRDVDAATGLIWGTLLAVTPDEKVVDHIRAYHADGSLAVELPTVFGPVRATADAGADGVPTAYPLVHDLRILADGRLMVSGAFREVDSVTAGGVVRLHADGTVDTSYVLPPELGQLGAVPQLLRDGRVLATAVRLLADGTIDPSFAVAPGESLRDVVELRDDSLVSGYFAMQRWREDGTRDPDFQFALDLTGGQSYPRETDIAILPDGSYYLGGGFDSVNNLPRNGLARLVRIAPHGISEQPRPHNVVAGGDVTLSVVVADLGEASYQWQFNGVDLPGATGSTLQLTGVDATQAGRYRAVIHVDEFVYTSDEVRIAVFSTDARLVNFSARSRVQRGFSPQIAGFVTAGAPDHPVLLRAIGRGMEWENLQDSLPRPHLALFSGSTQMASNEEGARGVPDVDAVTARLGAFNPFIFFPVASTGDLVPTTNAALLRELPGGSFTAQTTSATGEDGVSLFEFYDAAITPEPGFVRNVSLRGHTAPGSSTMIGGFVIAGGGPLTLLIRVVGPELADWDVADVLADPRLTLFAGSTEVAANNDWADGDAADVLRIQEAEVNTGAFPLDPSSLSAALVVTLDPGAYTFHATANTEGAPNETISASGEVLLEIYVIED